MSSENLALVLTLISIPKVLMCGPETGLGYSQTSTELSTELS